MDEPELTPAEATLLEIHRILYPERYIPRAQMEAYGIPVNADGYHEWSPDTPEAVAEALARYVAHTPLPGYIAESGPRPESLEDLPVGKLADRVADLAEDLPRDALLEILRKYTEAAEDGR